MQGFSCVQVGDATTISACKWQVLTKEKLDVPGYYLQKTIKNCSMYDKLTSNSLAPQRKLVTPKKSLAKLYWL